MKIEASLRLYARSASELVKQLKALGLKQLGKGKFAVVFKHPAKPDQVIKVLLKADPLYEKWMAFCKGQDNKYCPRVYEITDAYEGITAPFIMMEKLEPVSYNQYIDFGYHVAKVSKLKIQNTEKEFQDPALWAKVAKQTKDKDLAEVAAFFATQGKHLDIHDENVMRRGTQVVITDPFGAT